MYQNYTQMCRLGDGHVRGHQKFIQGFDEVLQCVSELYADVSVGRYHVRGHQKFIQGFDEVLQCVSELYADVSVGRYHVRGHQKVIQGFDEVLQCVSELLGQVDGLVIFSLINFSIYGIRVWNGKMNTSFIMTGRRCF